MSNPSLKDFKFIEESSLHSLNSNVSSHPLFSGVRMEFLNFDDHTFDAVSLYTQHEQALVPLDNNSRVWNIHPNSDSCRKKLKGWTL